MVQVGHVRKLKWSFRTLRDDLGCIKKVAFNVHEIAMKFLLTIHFPNFEFDFSTCCQLSFLKRVYDCKYTYLYIYMYIYNGYIYISICRYVYESLQRIEKFLKFRNSMHYTCTILFLKMKRKKKNIYIYSFYIWLQVYIFFWSVGGRSPNLY